MFKTRARTLSVSAVAASLIVGAAPAAAAPSADVRHEKVDGYLIGYPGDCPDSAPVLPLVCREWMLVAWRAGNSTDGPGGVAPARAPWRLFALRHTLAFPGAGEDPVESDVAMGFVEGPDVEFDRQNLDAATVHAPGVRLSDGGTADIDAAWTATADRQVYGNDGPALGEYGLVRHTRQNCLTANNQGHQKLRNARVDAVIDGAPSSYTGDYAFISFNQFISINVVPKGCES